MTAIQQQLKVYRQAVLKAAFEGKLTATWRKQHQPPAAEELLAQIQAERQQQYERAVKDWKAAVQEWQAKGSSSSDSGGRGKKPAKPSAPKEYGPLREGELVDLPEGWMWEKLGNLSLRIQIGPFGSQLHKEDYIQDGIPLINPKNIKDQKIFPDSSVSVTRSIFQEFPQYWLEEGDIVMGRRGEMGRCAPVSSKENMWFCGTGSLFIRLTKFSSNILFSWIIGDQRVVNYLNDSAIGTTMKNLNSTILCNIPMPVIPPEEQHQIVQAIESRLSICDQLEKAIANSLHQAEALRQSILKKAFEGRLVPQDPADEAAGVLLERIRGERAKT